MHSKNFFNNLLRLVGLCVGQVLVDLVLVAKDVVVHIVLLGRLRREHKRLHEATHGLAVVGQLASNLHHNATADRGLTVHLANLGVAVLEAERLDLLVDLELSDYGLLGVLTRTVDAAVHKRAPAAVKAVQDFGRLV